MAGGVGTVRGRFELDAPALRTLKDLEKQGVRTNAQMKELGKEMDRVGGRDAKQRIDTYKKGVKELQEEAKKFHLQYRKDWAESTRVVDREVSAQIRHLDRLQVKLRKIGSMRPTVKVNVDGVAGAIAEVELLEQKVNQLGRQRANAQIGTSGGARAAATGEAQSLARRGGRGGGGGRGSLRSVGVGPFNLGSTLGLGLIGGGLPLLPALGGAATGLLGSAGLGALGAGAAGAAGLGGAVGGFGAIYAAAKPAQTQITNAYKAQQKFNAALHDFGRSAPQTRNARRELEQAYKAAPAGTAALLGETAQFRRDFRRAERPAAGQFIQLERAGLAAGQRILPSLSRASLTSTVAARQQGTRFARFASGQTGRQFLGTSSEIFAENLPNVERTLENVSRTFVNIERAARPFFREGTDFVKNWTHGWATSTSDVTKTRGEIGKMVEHWRAWLHLTGSLSRLLKDVFNDAAPAGGSMVVSLSETFDRWDRWIKDNPGRTRDFFRRATNAASDFAKAVWEIIKAVGRLSTDLLPVLQGFSTLVSGAGALGLIGPGHAAALYGGYRALRGQGGRGAGGGPVAAGGGAGGGAPGFLPMFFGRGGGGGAGAAGRATSLAGRSVFIPGTAPRPGMFGGPLPARGGFTTLPADFRSGAPELLGSRNFALGRLSPLAGRAGLALRGAGRAALPVAAAMGVLDFAGFQGNVGQRTQAALSGATLGLIHRPLTASEQQDKVATRADQIIGDLPGGSSRRAQEERIRRLRSLTSGGGDAFASLSTSGFLGIGGSSPNADQLRRGNKMLKQELDDQVRALRNYKHNVRVTRLNEARSDIEQAFNIRLPKVGPQRAIQALERDTLKRLRGLGPTGARQLTNSSIQWARAAARGNPRLLKQIDDYAAGVVRRLRGMGQRVAYINGTIYDGSRKTWSSIASAIGTASEQALEEVTKNFTALQRKALGSLRAMGFSAHDARQLVGDESAQGRRNLRVAGQLATSRNRGERQAGLNVPQAVRQKVGPHGQARGGRLWGSGLGDNVRMSDGSRGAPGELVVNRHTEADHDRDARRKGLPTLAQRVAGETRSHSAPPSKHGKYDRWHGHPGDVTERLAGALGRRINYHLHGGGLGGAPTAGGGWTRGLQPGIIKVASDVLSHFPGLAQPSIGQTTGGGHAPGSYHYRGQAVDLSGSGMNQAAAWVRRRYGRSLAEGIHNPNLSISKGRPVSPGFWGSEWGQHLDHIHLAVAGAGGARGLPGGDGGMGTFQAISLRAPRSRLRGAPGALSDRASQMYARGLERKVNRKLRSMGGGGDLSGFHGGGSALANRRLGHRMMLAFGWPGGEWPSLDTLWTGESGWRNVMNAGGSGATGIPQALPGSKMASEGPDWATNPATQIAWGLKYIKGRYGTPSRALSAWQSRSPHWYGWGGRLASFRRGGSFTTPPGRGHAIHVGDNPYHREHVSVTPVRRAARPALGRLSRLGGVSMQVNFTGPVTVRNDEDLRKIAKQVEDSVGKKLLAALDGVDEPAVA